MKKGIDTRTHRTKRKTKVERERKIFDVTNHRRERETDDFREANDTVQGKGDGGIQRRENEWRGNERGRVVREGEGGSDSAVKKRVRVTVR